MKSGTAARNRWRPIPAGCRWYDCPAERDPRPRIVEGVIGALQLIGGAAGAPAALAPVPSCLLFLLTLSVVCGARVIKGELGQWGVRDGCDQISVEGWYQPDRLSVYFRNVSLGDSARRLPLSTRISPGNSRVKRVVVY